jgi:hypothetical protein
LHVGYYGKEITDHNNKLKKWKIRKKKEKLTVAEDDVVASLRKNEELRDHVSFFSLLLPKPFLTFLLQLNAISSPFVTADFFIFFIYFCCHVHASKQTHVVLPRTKIYRLFFFLFRTGSDPPKVDD